MQRNKFLTPEALDNVREQLVQSCTRQCSGWDLNPRPLSRKKMKMFKNRKVDN